MKRHILLSLLVLSLSFFSLLNTAQAASFELLKSDCQTPLSGIRLDNFSFGSESISVLDQSGKVVANMDRLQANPVSGTPIGVIPMNYLGCSATPGYAGLGLGMGLVYEINGYYFLLVSCSREARFLLSAGPNFTPFACVTPESGF